MIRARSRILFVATINIFRKISRCVDLRRQMDAGSTLGVYLHYITIDFDSDTVEIDGDVMPTLK